MTPAEEKLRSALASIVVDLGAEVDIELARPREDSHGDVSTNVAMKLAKVLKRPPRDIAEDIIGRLGVDAGGVTRSEVAGPGFINFWLAVDAVTGVLPTVLSDPPNYGRSTQGAGQKVNVEFVSANPTGPLHVGHGRGAALGDAIASLLEITGHEVTREFYVNDAGVQIDRLAESLWVRVQESVGKSAEIPDGGYLGEYVKELAESVQEEIPGVAEMEREKALKLLRDYAVNKLRDEQRDDLELFGVKFDVFWSETSLYEEDLIERALETLRSRDVVYESEGATWLRSTDFGDSKDRVIRKSDGTFTYLAPDIAYHQTKADRGFDRAIDIWGADHHGYISRMQSAMIALGHGKDFFQAVIVQLVKILRDGKEVKFSKRSGDFVTLRDLFEQTGVDASRYFFLMRRSDSPFVFDIDLATKQSDDNPVYSVQYAHTRLAGIFRNANLEAAEVSAEGIDLSVLSERDEIDLMKAIADYPRTVASAATSLEPHRVISYLEDFARSVNGWYHRHRVLVDDQNLMRARLVLGRAAQIVLANGLNLLGISAPERM